MAKTANELYRDAAIRHQIAVRRYTQGQVKQILRLLEEADAQLVKKLRDHLAKLAGKPLDFKSKRLQALLEDVRIARKEALAAVQQAASQELPEFAKIEHDAEIAMIQAAVPFEINLATVDSARLKTIATSRPFQGKLLKQWYMGLEVAEREQLVAALQLGLAQGETVDDIVRRIVGTRAKEYADGILSMTRRNAVAIARTAINHVSNAARNDVWDQNADVIQALVWVSTLDGRTSASCRARDGHGAPIGDNELPPELPPLSPPGVRPPGHINCRSTMVAYLSGIGLLGRRPFVVDTRTPAQRQVDFRRMAREQGRPIQEIRKEWSAKNIGQVPAATTYNDFLKRQDAAFQDEVLGKAKGRLFRQGGFTLDQFVDRSGNELTLAQLAARDPAAFIKAGLDPGDFD